jgi:hypothetical protein
MSDVHVLLLRKSSVHRFGSGLYPVMRNGSKGIEIPFLPLLQKAKGQVVG